MEVKSIQRIQSQLALLPRSVEREGVHTLWEHAVRIRDNTKARTPVRTGYMKGMCTIKRHPTERIGYEVGWFKEMWNRRFYAPYIELGTRHMYARRPLRDSFAREREAIKHDMALMIQRAVKDFR